MSTLYAGVSRRIINPPLGIKTFGFSSREGVVQAIESDLTATALVVSDGTVKIVVVATDTGWMAREVMNNLRRRVGDAIGTPASHVMINLNHTHSSPSMPEWCPDEPEQIALQSTYQDHLCQWVIEAVQTANDHMEPARIGASWGESNIGVYRREKDADGNVFLGEVPDHPIDTSVGVIRVDDRTGQPIATLFSYGCHTVTIGPRSLVASPDFPGAAREIIENSMGGKAMFLQACGGNIMPQGGLNLAIDCRDEKNRIGYRLGAEVIKVASIIRTHKQRGERKMMGSLSKITVFPWEPVTGDSCTYLGAVEDVVPISFIDMPPLEEAKAIRDECHRALEKARTTGARDWEISVNTRFADWGDKLVEAIETHRKTLDVGIQAIRINDIVLANNSTETLFETGLAIKAASPFPYTQVLGYSNGCVGYLPRAEDFPPGGWDIYKRWYGVPDLLFQAYSLPTAIHPNSEQQVVDRTLALLDQLR
jgi:neutral ceramidase